jgi:hypothetical protein
MGMGKHTNFTLSIYFLWLFLFKSHHELLYTLLAAKINIWINSTEINYANIDSVGFLINFRAFASKNILVLH